MMSVETPLACFALSVRARHEKAVAAALSRKGYDTYLPLYCGRHRSGGRFQDVWLPLFPSYVFCRFDIWKRLPILQTPSVLAIVGIGRIPSPVDESELASVRLIASSEVRSQPWPFLKTGDRVRIEEGPLRGTEGILVGEVKDSHFIVSITLLQRSISVPIERRWARPVGVWIKSLCIIAPLLPGLIN